MAGRLVDIVARTALRGEPAKSKHVQTTVKSVFRGEHSIPGGVDQLFASLLLKCACGFVCTQLFLMRTVTKLFAPPVILLSLGCCRFICIGLSKPPVKRLLF